MKTLHIVVLIVVGLLASLGVMYWQNLREEVPLPVSTELMQAINQCDLIAGKAAAGLPEALPFQKLEKMARQSKVVERCMQDRGYSENPAWVNSARRQAREIAQAQHISEDESYETLRRQAMLKEHVEGSSYWRKP